MLKILVRNGAITLQLNLIILRGVLCFGMDFLEFELFMQASISGTVI